MHEWPRKHLQRTVVACPEIDRARDGGRHWQNHAIRHHVIADQGVIDQEAVDPAIAVPHGVDVYKSESDSRCSSQRLGAPRCQLECFQAFEQLRQHLKFRRNVVHDVLAHGRLRDEDRRVA